MNDTIWKVIAGNEQKKLKISKDLAINCYVLENQQRVISELGLTTAIGFSRGKPSNTHCSETTDGKPPNPLKEQNTTQKVHENPRFTIGSWLFPYLNAKT